ncbi:ATPase [Thermoclostridium stercorarium subsp. leptospartum DSM 9219]|uniref:ATPase n=1 Tax=Thermoclostridium stercorarium subsp. leptospartum DSM 9219 TaxID=1346611 RepID=A0A1B1YIQ8_THEST|nr:cation-translocating P-type ATPase [Thermoclostridium stercorarium]ANX00655.1 ATPase [Thermoclostridium stercorarium subsp. leptospartum DSM 9219]
MQAIRLLPNNVEKKKKDQGLSSAEARRRMEVYGKNKLATKKKKSWLLLFISQFTDFMVLVLLAATAISMIIGDITEAITILAIVFINALLGFYQEMHTEKIMEAIEKLAAPKAKVIRDNEMREIPAEEVVPGDLTVIEAGDRIPADGVLIMANELQVDESMLTGESMPVRKQVIHNETDTDATFPKNHVYMGCLVTAGTGRAVVTKTGMETEMGKIAHMIQEAEQQDTPLQKRLETLGTYIVIACLVICAIVSLTGIIRGENVFSMLLAGISLAVAAVPEGLPAVVTIALALGVQRMAKRNALVRKLPAVETLGCATVICSDKTGTLTENKMRVVSIYCGRTRYQVTRDDNEENKNRILFQGKPVDPVKMPALNLMALTGLLCGNVNIRKVEDEEKISEEYVFLGDPTEVALVRMAVEAGYDPEKIAEEYKRLREIPFDSERKMMSVMCSTPSGDRIIFAKGAPEVILQRCTSIMVANNERKILDYDIKRIEQENTYMAQNALRVIAMAYRIIEKGKSLPSDFEQQLTFLGLAGMMDPPRKEAYDAVEKCKIAGIKPVMITGDHKETAKAVAKELKIIDGNENVLTGNEIESLSDRELKERLKDTAVFARVLPKHKLRLVKAYKEKGYIVAMTGDGVNDAPAVKEADIGVAMGLTGTDVTRQAASMILMDDNFSTIVAAVEEGRNIYNNIRKFIRYLLSCNIGEVLTMFLGMLMGLPVPLLPAQILLVNLVTDGLPAIALSMETGDPDIMKQKPRDPNEHIFSGGLWQLIITRGIFIGVVTLLSFILVFRQSLSLEAARTAALVTLVLSQLIHVFECKSEKKNIFEINLLSNLWLVGAVFTSLSVLACVVYVPALQNVFKTVPLLPEYWLYVAGLCLLPPVISSFFRSKKDEA